MTTNKSKHSDRRRTGQLSGIQIMFAAILAIGLILGINFTTLIASGQPLQELYQAVTEENERLKLEQAALIVERDYAQSDAYVERWARDEGKMVKPGEMLVIPVPSGASAQTTPIPEPAVAIETSPPEPEAWMVWWSLFFDNAPPAF